MVSRVVVTGTGFLGSALLQSLGRQTFLVGVSRQNIRSDNPRYDLVHVHDLAKADSLPFLAGCNAVIHTAARVHRMNADRLDVELERCRYVNTVGTLNVARHAASCGVKRFIFISSIKVNGEKTLPNLPFSEKSPSGPGDPYAISKYEAELGLWKISSETGMEIVIIRPPLVYGPGVKANFLRMLQWLESGIPLPLGSINNKRSLVALDNLVDFIWTCVEHPAAANQLFLVSDDHDLSTTELLHALAGYLGSPDRVFSFPPSLLSLTGRFLRKSDELGRLCGSLQVDISKSKDLLGWTPPVDVDDALKKTAEWYLELKRKGAIA